ncbi:MAG: hypothetical protein LCH60_14415 [Actinobacteria bacterium]|nr:hypothetical protein [Actinomycetota bacterium]
MAGLAYDRIRSMMNAIVHYAPDGEYEIRTMIDESDTWLGSWANDSAYVLVAASESDRNLPRTMMDVHAGGAYAMTPLPVLFQTLTAASWRFDFGGPWARKLPNGAAFGWRTRIPSDFFIESTLSDAGAFLTGMVDQFAAVCNVLADELLPLTGGMKIRAADPDAWPPLIRGTVPPMDDEIPPS